MSFKSVGKLSAPITEAVEPVGPALLAHARRIIRNRTWSEHERIENEERAQLADLKRKDDDDEFEDSEVTDEMLQHDPKDWKSFDQYAAIGLTSLRWRATEEQIRKAHRRQVLKYHPDKQASSGRDSDGFFKIIQKAFETLTDPVKRRQWDSVDKKANVAPPKKSSNFFEKWTAVFESESRFSTIQPVPQLGDENSSKEDVDRFYAFWYAFDSWRTFEWLDEDIPDDSSNRDNKRHIEKKNKASRAKHKKDDNMRLRKLVDQALSEDPRIQAFKEAERKAKEQRKWEREAGAREQAERERKAKEEAEEKARAEAAEAANAKKQKEQAKNAKKKNKRAIRAAVKDLETSLSPADAARMTADVDSLINALDDLALAEAATKAGELKTAEQASEFFTIGLSEKNLPAKYFGN